MLQAQEYFMAVSGGGSSTVSAVSSASCATSSCATSSCASSSCVSGGKRRRGAEDKDVDPAARIAAVRELAQAGVFRYDTRTMHASSLQLLRELEHWWTQADRLKSILLRVIDPSAENHVALRPLTWLVTNYARNRGILIVREGVAFNVERQHAAQLDLYKRRNFDTFRRGARVYFFIEKPPREDGGGSAEEDLLCETTVAQLNFIRWAHLNGVIQYAQENMVAIMADQEAAMAQTAERKSEERLRGHKPKRAALSKGVEAACTVVDMISFNSAVDVSFGPPT